MPSFSKAVSILAMVASLGAADMVTTRRLRGASTEETTRPHYEEDGTDVRRSLADGQFDDMSIYEGDFGDLIMDETHRSLVVSPKDVLIYNGNWGDWKGYVSAEEYGMYACGAEIRLQSMQGGEDDTAANGLRLTFCKAGDRNTQSIKTVHEGVWGDWTGMIMCPENKWISGASVRYENPIEGDNTALNGLRIWCADTSGNSGEWIIVHNGYWGDWKEEVMEPGMLVHAAEVRFADKHKISFFDDTTWNGLRFRMVPLNTPEDVTIYNGEWGDWQDWQGATNGTGFYACGAKVRLQEKQGGRDDTAANGLELQHCHIHNWEEKLTTTVYEGFWGEWGDMIECPEDTWITGAKVRFEDPMSGDDTALNGIHIICSPKSSGSGAVVNEEWTIVEDGFRGSLKDEVKRDGQFVTEAAVRFQDPSDSPDDTAWNGLRFRMLPFNTPEEVTIYDGEWGDWKDWQGVASGSGYYACGANVRFKDAQGGGDDTAAGGLELQFCHIDNWEEQNTKEIYYDWGYWGGMIMCPKDTWITGAKVRFEDPIDGDDTALNGLQILCSPKSNGSVPVVNGEWMMVEKGLWGEWKEEVKRDGLFVKAAAVRYEDDQGDGDDTAWNGLMFHMEVPYADPIS